MIELHAKFWNKSLATLARMSARGVELDSAYLLRQRDIALEMATELETGLLAWAGPEHADINWASPKQLAEFLYDYKGYSVPKVVGSAAAVKKNHKRVLSTSEASLNWLAKQYSDDNLRNLIKMRKLIKLSQFMTSLPSTAVNGRLHSEFLPKTDTGRLSSSNPNLQNIPTRNDPFKMRRAFIAKPGHLLVVADYSQLEMYVMAHYLLYYFDDDSLATDLASGDVHAKTALRIWPDQLVGATPETIKSKPEWKRFRDNAKTVNYAVPYGKTAAGLGDQITDKAGRSIGKLAAQEILDEYFASYPGLGRLFEQWKNEAKETGNVSTLTGRLRPLPNACSHNSWEQEAAFRQAVNTPVQGSAADIVTQAMVNVERDIPQASLVMQVHDELVVEVPEERAEETMKLLAETMENPFNLRVKLKVDADFGATWGDCK